MCVSRPLVMRGIFARKRENAKTGSKTRKHENAKIAKTAKTGRKTRKRENRENRENAKTRTEVQERESWTAMIISGSSGTSMQNNYIALQ